MSHQVDVQLTVFLVKSRPVRFKVFVCLFTVQNACYIFLFADLEGIIGLVLRPIVVTGRSTGQVTPAGRGENLLVIVNSSRCFVSLMLQTKGCQTPEN